MMDVALPPFVCVYCKNKMKKVMLACANCDEVAYCGIQCQKKDFKHHRTEICIDKVEKINRKFQESEQDDETAKKIMELYNEMCHKRDWLGTLGVKQLLKWKLVQFGAGHSSFDIMKCMIALGKGS